MERQVASEESLLFDRSWHNRAGMKKVVVFCADRKSPQALKTESHGLKVE
ncbi:MAG: hypothetical protein EBU79_00035 [Betaproteobacteria bacterium]|nr:hypothetical protein [Betaproteobacteria bacterium]